MMKNATWNLVQIIKEFSIKTCKWSDLSNIVSEMHTVRYELDSIYDYIGMSSDLVYTVSGNRSANILWMLYNFNPKTNALGMWMKQQ